MNIDMVFLLLHCGIMVMDVPVHPSKLTKCMIVKETI